MKTYFDMTIKEKEQNGYPKLPTNKMLLSAVNEFLKWVKDNNVHFLSSEFKVYSKKYNYAGTADFLAKIGNKLVLGDIKTSSGIWDEMHLQTASYKHAYQEEFPDQKIDHTVIVRCGKKGTEEKPDFEIMEMNEFEKNFNAFYGALILYRRLKEMKFNNLIQKQ